jgi:hypothetical protein
VEKLQYEISRSKEEPVEVWHACVLYKNEETKEMASSMKRGNSPEEALENLIELEEDNILHFAGTLDPDEV